jgi:hypothetical protein
MEHIKSFDLSGRVSRHPYQTLLIAAGVGYILGGGLFTRLSLTVLRIGVRVGAVPLVQRELLNVAEAVMGTQSNTLS